MQNLLNDLSILTCVESKDINKLKDISISLISHYIVESLKQRDTIASFDLGIGTLHISNKEDGVHYKFVPSKEFEKQVSDTYKTGKSRLKLDIEKALGSRLTNTYKDLL